ncbi:MAG: PAS domain-containing protein, partial [Burkholderiales bacterium]|nr:PAS domain-containing protein [Burkholderiales bacterium]
MSISEQSQTFKYLETIAEIVPCPFYWGNTDFRFLGANNMFISGIGSPNKEYIMGKTLYELYQNEEIANTLQQDIDKMFQTGEISRTKDKIIDVTTGKIRHYISTKAPLRDSSGKIVGLVGTSIEQTEEIAIQKSLEKELMFKYVTNIAEAVPAPFYLLDLEGKFAVINNCGLNAVGASSKDHVIGKNVYDLYQNQTIGDELQRSINKVIKTAKVLHVEDIIKDVTTGKLRYYVATRAPLCDSNSNIIGVLGISIEITAEKEAKELRIKNEQQEAEKELLQLENDKYLSGKKAQETFIQFIGGMLNMIQRFKLETVNKQLGTNNLLKEKQYQ